MKHIAKISASIIASAALTAGGAATAGDMFIDVGTNQYDLDSPYGGPNAGAGNVGFSVDANTTTGTFNEFGFNQILATSIYDLTVGAGVFGAFSDTNDPFLLAGFGVPTSGLAMDNLTTVNLVLPNTAPAIGQSDLDALSPLVPPLGTDAEGFLQTWDLQVIYNFVGNLSAAGPSFTSGFFDIYFNDLTNDANDRKVLTGTVTNSTIALANLDIFFDITFAEDDFLWIEDANGNFVDANDGTITGNYATFHLDTNVNPPIPAANQLLVVGTNAIRQTTLDGSLTAAVPEPATIALLGLGLLGLGVSTKHRKSKYSVS